MHTLSACRTGDPRSACRIDLLATITTLLGEPEPNQARAVLGDRPAEAIAGDLQRVVQRFLGAGIAECTNPSVSVGVTLQVVLGDGRPVVLKALRPSPTLGAAIRVQAELADHGFPTAGVLFSPTPCGSATVYGMEQLDPGEPVVYGPAVRRTLAHGLARLVSVAEAIPIDDSLVRSQAVRKHLWGRPHSAIFDFEATVEGAESIDRVATIARDRLASTEDPPVIVHDDWSLQNVGLRAGELCAVFDCDSIVATSEPIAVAHAAAFHSQDWRGDVVEEPSHYYLGVDETMAFVEAYADARERRWSTAERDTTVAALMFRLAYQARCQHALDPSTCGPARARLDAFAQAFGLG